jgi:hypothetical protein
MDEHLDNEPIVDDDGELVQPDKQVDLDQYAEYVRNFRPNPRIRLWPDWDKDEVLTAGCIGFGIVVFLIFCMGMLTGLSEALGH